MTCQLHGQNFKEICPECQAFNIEQARLLESEKVIRNQWWNQ